MSLFSSSHMISIQKRGFNLEIVHVSIQASDVPMKLSAIYAFTDIAYFMEHFLY